MAKASLQSTRDVVDTLARVMAYVVTISRASWLQNSSIVPSVQQAIEDLPFGLLLFSDKTVEMLHFFKNSRAILQVHHCDIQEQHQQPYCPQHLFGQPSPLPRQRGYPIKGKRSHRMKQLGLGFGQSTCPPLVPSNCSF